VGTLFIEPGSSREDGYNESFNGKLRAALLDRGIFYTLEEGKVLGSDRGLATGVLHDPSRQCFGLLAARTGGAGLCRRGGVRLT
jgi:hypothetical protein